MVPLDYIYCINLILAVDTKYSKTTKPKRIECLKIAIVVNIPAQQFGPAGEARIKFPLGVSPHQRTWYVVKHDPFYDVKCSTKIPFHWSFKQNNL